MAGIRFSKLKVKSLLPLLCVLIISHAAIIRGRKHFMVLENGFQDSDLVIQPSDNDSIPIGGCDEISVSMPDYFSGRLSINHTTERYPTLSRTIEECVRADEMDEENDTIENPDKDISLSTFSDTIKLTPALGPSGRVCRFYLHEELPSGNWQLNIPEGYFDILPEYIEVDSMPLPYDRLMDLTVCAAWHKRGNGWDRPAMFSIHDDDGVDGKIPSCGSTHIPDRNGYFTMLFPLLQSLGVKGNVSMEGWRCGFTADPPELNDNGKIMLRLEKELGWEMQAHSMEVLGDQNNNWYVDSLNTELAGRILREAVGFGPLNTTTSIYDASTGLQYYPNDERTEWVESPRNKIKPYALEYPSKRPILYIQDHNVDYHWGEWARIARENGFKAMAWVQHNSISSHNYASAINRYLPYGFNDMPEPYQYNLPPMRSTATRMLLEGQSAPGYIGESSDDNSYDYAQYEWFCDYIDRCAEEGGWIILGLHTYRKCWKNYIEGALVSEGGDYPDEWVDPLQGMDYLNDSLLTPPERLGISDWSEWRPCPGTRLDMMRDIILYCLEKNMLCVTSSEGFEIMGNPRSAGYFNGNVRIGYDRYKLIDDRDTYPHYLLAANGEEYYYQSVANKEISSNFKIYRPDISVDTSKVTITADKVRYYNMNGHEVNPVHVGKGFYIMLDARGYHKILR